MQQYTAIYCVMIIILIYIITAFSCIIDEDQYK